MERIHPIDYYFADIACAKADRAEPFVEIALAMRRRIEADIAARREAFARKDGNGAA